jgi:hypothetical protein
VRWCEVALATRDVEAMRRAIADLATCGAGFFGLNALAESAALHLAFAHPGAIEPPVASTVLTPVLAAVSHEREAYELQLAGEARGGARCVRSRSRRRWNRQGMWRFARRAELAAAEITAAAGHLDRAAALVHDDDETDDVTARRRAALERDIARRRAIERLTPREIEILRLVAQGLTSREISSAARDRRRHRRHAHRVVAPPASARRRAGRLRHSSTAEYGAAEREAHRATAAVVDDTPSSTLALASWRWALRSER